MIDIKKLLEKAKEIAIKTKTDKDLLKKIKDKTNY